MCCPCYLLCRISLKVGLNRYIEIEGITKDREDAKLLRIDTNTNINTDRKMKAELIRARNREKIAQSKLACLKARYQKLQDEMSCCKSAMLANHHHCEALRKRAEEAMMAEAEACKEAEAWKAKAFEKMDELEMALGQVQLLEQELELAWARSEADEIRS